MRLLTLVVGTAAAWLAATAAQAQTGDARSTCGEFRAQGQAEACRRYIAADPDPDLDWALRNLANALLGTGDFEEAVKVADRFAAIAEDPIEGLTWQCLTRAVAGIELVRAAAACDQGIAMGGPDFIHTARGLVRLKLGQNADAWSDFDRTAGSPGAYSEQPLFGRGLAGLRLGRDGAASDIETALQIDPEVDDLFREWGFEVPATSPATRAPNPPTASAASDLTSPQWIRRPVALESDYPARALDQEVEGSATVRCLVEDTGRLTGCEVLRETPEGYGFGQAAIRAASRARISPESLRQASPGRTVMVRIDFRPN